MSDAGPVDVTPIPELTSEEEKARLAALVAQPPDALRVVSDLHIGRGHEAGTGRYARRENFLADRAFRRFLADRSGGPPGLLILNGDIFDFLRIDDAPKGEAEFAAWRRLLARLGRDHTVDELRRSLRGHERRFGLQTDDFKCVYKLDIMVRGHREFFAALADWVSAGGGVLYVKGNHDVEQHWPLVRRALRDAIHQAGADAGAVTDRVYFADGQVALANLHIEHGHNYESLTRVDEPPELEKPAGQLRIPLGSFVNRYVVNKLERIEPFLDNIKPVTDVLWTLARRRPLSVFQIIARGARLLARSLRRFRIKHALLAGAIVVAGLAYLVPLIVIAAVVLFFAWPAFADWIRNLPLLGSPLVRAILSVAGALLPFIINGVKEVLNRLRRPRVGEDEVAAGVYEKLARSPGPGSWRTRYAVIGHTHHQDVQVLPPVGPGVERTLYVNSGTWAPLWPKDRPDLVGRTVYSFIRFERRAGEYAHEQLVWDDAVGAPRPATMLTPGR